MWELDCEESWVQKNWCFWTVVLEKTLESPLDCKEIQPVHPKGDQSWLFIGRTDAEASTLATSCEELTHWKKSWCWERLGAGGEGDNRGWDGWMAPPTRWAWCAVIHGVAKSWTRLSDWTELNAPTNICYHRIDVAYDYSMYYQLSNPFCLCPGQQATICSANSNYTQPQKISLTLRPTQL